MPTCTCRNDACWQTEELHGMTSLGRVLFICRYWLQKMFHLWKKGFTTWCHQSVFEMFKGSAQTERPWMISTCTLESQKKSRLCCKTEQFYLIPWWGEKKVQLVVTPIIHVASQQTSNQSIFLIFIDYAHQCCRKWGGLDKLPALMGLIGWFCKASSLNCL